MTHLSKDEIRRKLQQIRDAAARLLRTTRSGLASAVSEYTVGDWAEHVDHETRAAMSSKAVDLAQQCERAACTALKRLDAGTLGLCLDCREPIPQKRMDATDYLADRCISCQEITEQQGRTSHRHVPHALFPEP